jgi:2-methylaconitate cis-trans-isomerase PrpF
MASEREKEIKRRRKRRKQITHLRARAAKATGSEKQVIADKLRNMTPGYKVLIDSMGLAKK